MIPDWLLAILPAVREGVRVAALEWSHRKRMMDRRRHYAEDVIHVVPSNWK